jgi:putative membrane protein
MLLLVTWILLAASLVGAPYPSEQPLQNAPTAIALIALGIASRKKWLSRASLTSLVLFLWLHILGARWIYSNVPYDDWFRMVCGRSASEIFGWQRNHYDRLVHFGFGWLMIAPLEEILRRTTSLRLPARLFFSIALVLAVGAVYEIFEWSLAVLVAPDRADRYNGQQGDMWDSQKDMAIAAVGAVASAAVFAWRARRAPAGDVSADSRA